MSRVVAVAKRAVREPLLQFLVIGAALFGANSLINGPDRGPAGETITITEGQVKQIAESYLLLSGRLPSRPELQALVDDYVTEEIDYREAVAMGLDSDDTIVRRRMRQKLEFLVEDASASDTPSEAELQAWLDSHAADYRLPERRAIRQVLASRDRRGAKVEADARGFLAKLKSGGKPDKIGDPSMLPAAVPLMTEEGLAAQFGEEFAHAAFAHSGEGWFGPIASPFGAHLVLVMDIAPGRAAALADVRDRIGQDIIEHRRNQTRDDFQARMRKRYAIRIDWPDPYDDLPAIPNPTPKTKPAPPEVSE